MTKKAGFVLLVFIFAALMSVEMAFAGAWTTPKHMVWAEWYQKFEYAKEGYNANWKRGKLGVNPPEGNMDGRNWGFTIEPKIDYGITNELNFLWRLRYKEYHYKEYAATRSSFPTFNEFNRKNNGIEYIGLGGKYLMVDKPVLIAAQAIEWIYGGYGIYRGDERTPDRYNQYTPEIGSNGSDGTELRIIVSKQWNIPMSMIKKDYKLPVYASGETGYQFNNRHVANYWLYFLEGGFWPVPWLLLKTELDGIKSHDGTGSIKEQAYGIWRSGFRWHVLKGDAYLRDHNKAFDLEFQYGMYLWGKNATAYNEFVLKVDVQF